MAVQSTTHRRRRAHRRETEPDETFIRGAKSMLDVPSTGGRLPAEVSNWCPGAPRGALDPQGTTASRRA
ncbi:hypothetical protein [Halorubrum sp. Ib24]|uniref:hypothetical protein n=1 Tax=Halorubrum sp. Ib24 TaxID=1383850 RepID=UPI001F53C979|nr:hypothetical protein [Halorubrum sp. Ib24]